jgi:hypothetical protein
LIFFFFSSSFGYFRAYVRHARRRRALPLS